MYKRVLLLALSLVFTLLIVGCTGNSDTSEVSNNINNVDINNSTSEADNFPEKPIDVIVPYGAGGATDLAIRAIGNVIDKYLPNNQRIVIHNKAGGSGVIGTTEVWAAEPDGYTIAIVPPSPLSVQPLHGLTEYQPEDFQGIIRISSAPLIFVVKADAPWDTFEEWHKWVKENPGEFSYASGARGAPSQLALEQFIIDEGLQTRYIPFESTAEVYTNLIGGHVDGISVSALQVKEGLLAGDLKALANLGSIKSEDFLKDIPTIKEIGYDYATDAYTGLVAHKDVPKQRIEILHDAFKQALEDPEVVEFFENNGIIADYGDPEEFTNHILSDYESFGATLRSMGLID